MPNTAGFSETKRALLEKYTRSGLPRSAAPTAIIPRRVPDNSAPLSFEQQQLWLLAELIPDMPVYNESVTVRLSGPLNVVALERSLNEIIRRHEAWRTSFPVVDGQPVQVIHLASPLALLLVDLRHLPESEREAEAIRLATEEAMLPFDLAQCPLLRATLIKLDEEDHRLFLALHHIIFDGTIYQIFLPELQALYDAFASGKPSPLPELPIQYADFAAWQRGRPRSDVFAEQLAYWKKQLAGVPATLELPTDHPRPPVQSYRGARRPFALTRHLTDALKALSRREGVTLYMSLVAAFTTLLYRYTGQDDIHIGTTTEGRKQSEVQRLIGFFLNTLVLRTNLTGNPPFCELLRRVREVVLESHAHSDLPFEYLVKELRPERSLAQNPLIQVMLSLEPPLPALQSGWTMTLTDVDTRTSKFDLSVELDDRPEGLIGWFEYSTDLFEESAIARMIGHWQTLLEGIVRNPGQPISELPLLTGAERRQILVEWNDTALPYPEDQCLHTLFEAQVERTPDAMAVVCEDEQLTYQELNSKANQLAHYLRQLGIGPEMLVGVCMERSVQMVVALLGILKAGGAYVPLDPAYPRERITFMLQDAQVSILLTQQRLVEKMPSHTAAVVCLDTDWQKIARQSDKNPVNTTMPEYLSYVLYTSGSTGRPKGVAIEHRNAVAFIHWAKSVFPLEDFAGVLASTSICFDLSVFELFVPLSCGGTVQLVENVLDLLDISPSRQVTLVNTVPSAIAHLLHSHRLPASVRTVNLAGEALPGTLVKQLYSQGTVRKVFNLYGPTETTTYSTYALIGKGEQEPYIGRPLANTQVYILDAHLHPVPIEVVGELYIGGNGVARGYLNHPELTAEKFIPHPFSQKPGARLYKTGDLARYLPDGNIKFLGRNDSQVKIRGFRIELGEIEEVLREYPQVRETAVVVREDGTGEKRLAAYVVAAQDRAPRVKDIQSFLQGKLPEYMIPLIFVLLNALPRTPNGKLDRRALPKPAEYAMEEGFVAPMSLVHYQLISIWEELLGVRPIGIRDNFFSLGGHSLLAARLVDRIEQVYAKKIALPTLFAGPTIEHLANVLQGQEDRVPNSPVVAIQAGKFKRPFFFLHGDYKSGGFYCYPLAHGLGSDQPFYALEPYRFEGLRVPPPLKSMAASHIELIRAIQPEGPYLLGGFCGGGLIAYEMARQLHAQGQMLDLLVLIDPTPIAYLKRLHTIVHRFGNLMRLDENKQLDGFLWLRHLYRYVQHLYRYVRFPQYGRLETELNIERVKQNGGAILALKALHELRLGQDTEYLGIEGKLESGGGSNKMSFALPGLASIFPDSLFPTTEALREDWEGVFHWAASYYVPDFYPGKSTFFFFRDSVEDGRSGRWSKVVQTKDKEVEIHVVAGTHDTAKTRHLHDLAERLGACLSKAQTTTLIEDDRSESLVDAKFL